MSRLDLPILPTSLMFDGDKMTREWQEFFRLLFERVGDSEAYTNLELAEFVDALRNLDSSLLVATDSDGDVISVEDLTEWIKGKTDNIDVGDNTDGTVTLSISDFFLVASILGTANRIIVTDNSDGTVTLSTPQDIHTDANVIFDSLVADWIKVILDNGKILFGADSDASIYYDGTSMNLKTDEVVSSDFKIECGSGKTVELLNPVYEDLQVSISNIKIPASSAPSDRLYDHGVSGGVTFPVLGFDVGEYVYFDVQTSHSMKLNTILDNHIHFMTPDDGTGDRFQFQLDVIAAGIGGSWAVPTGSPFTSEHIILSDYSNAHVLDEIADIPSANTTVSSIYSFKLTRIAATQDEYGDEVYLKFTDCHYQKNTMGSREEGAK